MLPNGSSTGPAIVPLAVTRSVWPLIVRSPVTVTLPPSTAMSVDSKRIRGYCSASKNSGDWQVRDEVLVLDDDGVDRHGADELGAAVVVDGQLGVERARSCRGTWRACA